MDPSMKLAIRLAREDHGLTQEQCAAAAKFADARTWSNLERPHGRQVPPNAVMLDRIASAAGTTAENLLRKSRDIREENAPR